MTVDGKWCFIDGITLDVLQEPQEPVVWESRYGSAAPTFPNHRFLIALLKFEGYGENVGCLSEQGNFNGILFAPNWDGVSPAPRSR